ncbi:hypothetical protein DL98DRAFT_513528 [Cadophora sp. DSE1049]|nr:hypothetical protein DL98DRAFT_513528 [Cadophora sp. DSE1049]
MEGKGWQWMDERVNKLDQPPSLVWFALLSFLPSLSSLTHSPTAVLKRAGCGCSKKRWWCGVTAEKCRVVKNSVRSRSGQSRRSSRRKKLLETRQDKTKPRTRKSAAEGEVRCEGRGST